MLALPPSLAIAGAVIFHFTWSNETEGDSYLSRVGAVTILSSLVTGAAVLVCFVAVAALVCEPVFSMQSLSAGQSDGPILPLGLVPAEGPGCEASLVGRAARARYIKSQCDQSWLLWAALQVGLLDMGALDGPSEDIAVAAEALLSAQSTGPDVTDHVCLLADSGLAHRIAVLSELFAGTAEGVRLRSAHHMVLTEAARLAALLEPTLPRDTDAPGAIASVAGKFGDEVPASTSTAPSKDRIADPAGLETRSSAILRKWQRRMRRRQLEEASWAREAARESAGGHTACSTGQTQVRDKWASGDSPRAQPDGESDEGDDDSDETCSEAGSNGPLHGWAGMGIGDGFTTLPERVIDRVLSESALDAVADALLCTWPGLAVAPPPYLVAGSGPGEHCAPETVQAASVMEMAARSFVHVRWSLWTSLRDSRRSLFAPLAACRALAGLPPNPVAAAVEAGATGANGWWATRGDVQGSDEEDAGLREAEVEAEAEAEMDEALLLTESEIDWAIGDEDDKNDAEALKEEEDTPVSMWRRRARVMERLRKRRAAVLLWEDGRQWERPTLPGWELHGESEEVVELATASVCGSWRCVNWASVTPEMCVSALLATGITGDAARLLGASAGAVSRRGEVAKAAMPPPTSRAAGSSGTPIGRDAPAASAESGDEGTGAGADFVCGLRVVRDLRERRRVSREILALERCWLPRMFSALAQPCVIARMSRLVALATGRSAELAPLPLTLEPVLLPLAPEPVVLVPRTSVGDSNAAGTVAPSVPLPVWVSRALALAAVDADSARSADAVAAAAAVAMAAASPIFARRLAEAAALAAALPFSSSCSSGCGLEASASHAFGRAACRHRLFVENLDDLAENTAAPQEGKTGRSMASGAPAGGRPSRLLVAQAAAEAAGLSSDPAVRREMAAAAAVALAARTEAEAGDAQLAFGATADGASASFECFVVDLKPRSGSEVALAELSPDSVCVAGPCVSMALAYPMVRALRHSLGEAFVEVVERPSAEDGGDSGRGLASVDSTCESQPLLLQTLKGETIPRSALHWGVEAPSSPRPRFVVVIGPVVATLPNCPSPGSDNPGTGAPPRSGGTVRSGASLWALSAPPRRVGMPLIARSVILPAEITADTDRVLTGPQQHGTADTAVAAQAFRDMPLATAQSLQVRHPQSLPCPSLGRVRVRVVVLPVTVAELHAFSLSRPHLADAAPAPVWPHHTPDTAAKGSRTEGGALASNNAGGDDTDEDGDDTDDDAAEAETAVDGPSSCVGDGEEQADRGGHDSGPAKASIGRGRRSKKPLTKRSAKQQAKRAAAEEARAKAMRLDAEAKAAARAEVEAAGATSAPSGSNAATAANGVSEDNAEAADEHIEAELMSLLAPPATGVPRAVLPPMVLLPLRGVGSVDPREPSAADLLALDLDGVARAQAVLPASSALKSAVQDHALSSYPKAAGAGLLSIIRASEPQLLLSRRAAPRGPMEDGACPGVTPQGGLAAPAASGDDDALDDVLALAEAVGRAEALDRPARMRAEGTSPRCVPGIGQDRAASAGAAGRRAARRRAARQPSVAASPGAPEPSREPVHASLKARAAAGLQSPTSLLAPWRRTKSNSNSGLDRGLGDLDALRSGLDVPPGPRVASGHPSRAMGKSRHREATSKPDQLDIDTLD